MVHRFLSARLAVSCIAVSFLAAACTYVLLRLLRDLLVGRSNSWQQGDWLINRETVEIRRGHIGSLILEFSDFLQVNPLVATFGLQAGLTVLLFGLLVHLFVTLRQPLILAPLVLSPGIFAIFWLADSQGAFRKEMIAFVSILLVLYACKKGSNAGLVAAAGLLVMAVYGHEANVLFLPLFLTIVWLCRDALTKGKGAWLGLIIVTGGSLHGFWYGYAHRHLDDFNLVCTPLLNRGLDPTICDGAILWLTYDLEIATRQAARFATPAAFVTLSMIYALILVPVLFVLSHLKQRRLIIPLAILSTLPFLPLYVVAIDWGRWISMQTFSMVALGMAALVNREATVLHQPPLWTVLVLMALSLLWAPGHTLGIHWLWSAQISASVSEVWGW